MSATARPKIVLLGMLTKMPVGGVAWLVGQYALGFERLGYEVYYVEAHARTPSMFVLTEHEDGTDAAAAYLARVMGRFGLGDRWAFHALHADGRCVGMTRQQLDALYRDAALIINMHGGTVPLPEHAATGRLILLSTDPVEIELEIARGEAAAIEFLDAHVAYFTWGLNHGNPDCLLPWAERYPFVPSPPPIVADQWANDGPPPGACFTTIGNWRQNWRQLSHGGETYQWSKHHEFLKIIDLPSAITGEVELALSSTTEDDVAMLRSHGWRVRPGLEVSREMDDYRRYLIGSLGEFTVAKDQNIRFRSGWFSERSTCYLAAGRPVITQDTGFGNWLATGEGLLPFSDLDSAVAAVESVLAHGERHRRAALDIAASQLAADVVLPAMLRHCGLPVPPGRRSAGPVVARPASAGPVVAVPAVAVPNPAELPAELCLVPVSRRPLALPADVEASVLARPVPSVAAADGPPRASLVMAVHDNLAVTRLALESVLATTEGPYEVVVIDNGSQEPTRQYLSVLAARNDAVRLIVNDHNRGFAPAVNQGLAAARGEYLVLLNNDVVVVPGWLDGLLEVLDDPTVGLVGPVTNRCGNEAEVPTSYRTHGDLLAFVAARAGLHPDGPGAGDPDLFDLPVATMFCVALRRATYEQVGPLDERFEIGMFEDDDYSRRTRAAGLRVCCRRGTFVHHFGEASIGRLAAEGRYGELFHANRRRFEDKWGEPWQPHARGGDDAYAAAVARVVDLVDRLVAPDGRALVISRGDEELVPPGQRRLVHFPCLPDGVWAGGHPADDVEAIARLESMAASGATHLVIPAASFWWLDHYREFARYLDTRHERVADEPDTAVVYRLRPAVAERSGGSGGSDGSGGSGLLEIPFAAGCVELAVGAVPPDSVVLVAVADGVALPDLPHGAGAVFPLGCEHAAFGGVVGADCPCGVARLEAWRARGAAFLLAELTDAGCLGAPRPLADHLGGHYAVTARCGRAVLFDLRERRLAPHGGSRALAAVAEWIALGAGDDTVVLDWTRLGHADRLGALSVFTSDAPLRLPYLDRSVPIVVVDDPARRDEALRVASVAVVVVGFGREGTGLDPVVVDLVALDDGLADRLAHRPELELRVLGGGHDHRHDAPRHEALADQLLVGAGHPLTGTGPRRSAAPLLVVEPGVLPLPGALDVARAVLGAIPVSGRPVGAVVMKLFGAAGALAAAGVTVFADGSWRGTAQGAADVAAPWHEFVRDSCGGAGLILVHADAAAAVLASGAAPVQVIDWAAAVWRAGFRVVYQPEAHAVQVDPWRQVLPGATGAIWAPVLAARPTPPGPPDAPPTAVADWRSLIARDDVAAAWSRNEEDGR